MAFYSRKRKVDRAYSRHMRGKALIFFEIKEQLGGTITLRDEGKCHIIGVGKINNDSLNSINYQKRLWLNE